MPLPQGEKDVLKSVEVFFFFFLKDELKSVESLSCFLSLIRALLTFSDEKFVCTEVSLFFSHCLEGETLQQQKKNLKKEKKGKQRNDNNLL